jgi:RHS repeat-associated protein
MNGYSWGLDGIWSWTTGTSITIDPGPGYHTLSLIPESGAGIWGPRTDYAFGVGTSGAVESPADQSQTSSTVALQAAVPGSYTGATFYYRTGTTGSFTQVPAGNVTTSSGGSVTWPAGATGNAAGTQVTGLTWAVTHTLADDAPVQIEATFTNGSTTLTTPAVTFTLDRVGTGADYGTTSAGPFNVGLQSGNAALSATDVSIAAYGAALSVSRTFNSLEPNAASPFGPGWTTSLGSAGGWTQLTDSSTYAVLHAADGTDDEFTPGTTNGSTVTWTPAGSTTVSGLTLTQNTSSNTFTLTDGSGTVTVFSQPASAVSGPYLAQSITQPGTASSAGTVYDSTSTDASYGKPVLEVAPDPASTSAPTTACPYPASASTWTAGCRGLQFFYNSSGSVTEIDFDYSDNSGTYHSVPVADYGYDTAGRLTSEYDPRLATPLVTSYAYDETSGDANYGRITQVTPAQSAGSGALAPWTATYDTTSGDANYGKLLSVSRTHNSANGGTTATTTVDYSVPLTTAAGGPVNMDTATVAGWGESDPPASAVATFPPTHVPSSPPTSSDWQYATVQYYDAAGREVNTASYTGGAWAVATTQYDAYGNTAWTLTADNRITALASSDPVGAATALATVNVYGCDNFGTVGTCTSSDQQYEVLTGTYGPAHLASVDGTVEIIRTYTADDYDSGAPNSDVSASGSPYMLKTSQTTSASVGNGIPGSSTADARTTSYTYGTTAASWALGEPLTTVTDPGGLAITKTSVYNTSSSLYGGAALLTDTYMPSDTAGGGAGDTQTVYYTAGTNSVVAACGNKPEWTDLTCQTGPAGQPGTSGLPSLPVTTYAYDDYLNPVTKTETYGTTGTRVTTTTYDAAERSATQTVTVSGTGMGTAVPKTQVAYATATGLPGDIETLNSGGTITADIKTTYDDFGQTLSYTDAAGNVASYTHDLNGDVTVRADTAGSGGTDTITYNSAGEPAQLVDSKAGTFTAAYDADGNLTSEVYPGGAVTATYTYDATGTATSLQYSDPAWTAPLTDAITPNAAGDWASQSITDTATPTVGTQSYTYDNADRLTAVLDTGNAQCRSYAYDVDSNRTSSTTATPGSDGLCADATGAVTSTSSYDSADRDTNSGYAYDTQGDITTTPAADAGGTSSLTAAYYANDMLASQTQGSTAMTWTLDPTLGRYQTYTRGGVTYTDYYDDTSNNPIGTTGTDGSWLRNVTDLNGILGAEVTLSGVTLEFPDLHGDILATATTSTTATGPTNTYLYSEFGAPENSAAPGTYGWLGGDQISSNALGGQQLMGARAYNASTGRFSQVDPVPGGSANSYDYSAQNPITNMDLTGQWWWNSWKYAPNWYAIYFHVKIEYLTIALWVAAGAGGIIASAICALMGLPSSIGSIVAGALCGVMATSIITVMAAYASDLPQQENNVEFFWNLWVSEHHFWGIPYWIPHWHYGGSATWQ